MTAPPTATTVELRELGRSQLGRYAHVRVLHHTITSVEGDAVRGFSASSQAGTWHGRTLVLATGVPDHFLNPPDLEAT